ncbi:Remorin, C-terminal [Dillenia turbinata]|uniref:Remorin, C-terminal n=1 Tax=Dillenia turbinata TaxID=194707 RepID=A0AAN8YZY6_9MAGN
MAEEEQKTTGTMPSEPPPASYEPLKDVPEPVEKKSVVEEKVEDSKALTLVEKAPDPAPEKTSGGSLDRDVALARVETEKRLSFIKAWEESEKTKAENKAQKKLSAVLAWENSQKASFEAKLRKIEEQLEKKKAEYGEQMKNKVAATHRQAEEKRAMVEARKGEEILRAEEMGAKYRATNQTPKSGLGCFGC